MAYQMPTSLDQVQLPGQIPGVRSGDTEGGFDTLFYGQNSPQEGYTSMLRSLGYMPAGGIDWNAPFQKIQGDYKTPFSGTTADAYKLMYPNMQKITDPTHGDLLQLGQYNNTGIDYFTGAESESGWDKLMGSGFTVALPLAMAAMGGAFTGGNLFGSGGGAVFGDNPEFLNAAGFGTSSAAESAGASGITSIFGNTTGGGMDDLLKVLQKAGVLPGSQGGLGSIFNIGRGLYGMYQGSQMKDLAERAMTAENPFGPERAGYAAKLRNLYNNPNSITSMPGYEAGLTAVERKMAAQGYNGSGNMMAALQKYGGDFFNSEADRLATLAGAKFAPSGGSQLLAGNIAGNQMQGNSLNSLIYGALGLASPMRSGGSRSIPGVIDESGAYGGFNGSDLSRILSQIDMGV